MSRKSIADYPPDWPEIALAAKNAAGWKCVRCKHPHEPGHILTVHHLDMDPSNNRWWNIPPLCQVCHLVIQAKVYMNRDWMFEHSPWFKPYVAGYYAYLHGKPDDREWVTEHLEQLLEYGRPPFTSSLDNPGSAQ